MGKEYFIVEGTLLDEKHSYTLRELVDLGLTDQDTLVQMMEYGIIDPIGKQSEQWVFTARAIVRSQKALRLHHDLSIDWSGISLALDLLDEIEALRAQLQMPVRRP
jgi:chaperone modulatory protein CbpM